MDISSSRLDNEGKVESLYMRIPNDDALTEQDCPQTGVDKEVEKPKESMMLCSEEESDDNEDNVLLSKMIDGDEKVEPPKKSMTFSSHEEVISYYKKYAKQVGFGVSRRMIKKTPDGHPRYMLLTCIRECSRVRNTSNAMKPNPTTNRTKCNARICATLWDDGTWFLSKVVVEHNHSLSPSKARFLRCYKNINDPAKRRRELNDRAGICANKNFNSLVEMGEFENLPFGERECRNFINKARELRLGKGGGQALCDYFTRMRSQNDGFYYVMDMDDNGRLQNVFWADARSRAAYEFFGDAITFDTTYLTNRYDIPFTPFVGVNHHGQSILFGAGLISNEDTDTFVWLFESWLKCMNNRAPSAIITNRTRAMKNAIARVFPKTRHRYCLWHIMRKLPEKFGSHDHYNDIRSALNTCLYDSITVDEFEKNWKILIESYQLQDNPWLNRLYRERTFWVAAYMKDTCWAGMDTTQQSENMNGFLDGYVHSKTTIKEFLDLFDNALRKMVERETHSDFDCFNHTIPCLTVFPLEKLFQHVYTNAKFKEVQEQFGTCVSCNNSLLKSEGAISTYQVIETVVVLGNRMIDKIFGVFFNEDEFEVKCTCAMFELRGIICKHSISVLLTKKVTTLPSRYILDRWMKNIKRKYTLIKSSSEAFVGNSSSQRYDRMCKNCEELASLTSESVEYFMEVMKTVDMLKEKYRALRSVALGQRYHNVSHAVASASCNEAIQSNDGKGSISMATTMAQTLGSHHDFVLTQVVMAVDPTNELSKLVSQQKYEEAFDAALQRCDVSIVYWLCSQVDLLCILSIDPLPLSQVVLLYLLRHLSYGINNNIPQKFGWMTHVANAIIPTDSMIAMHVRPIFNEVYALLNHQQYLPTIIGYELLSIRSLMHVIISKII